MLSRQGPAALDPRAGGRPARATRPRPRRRPASRTRGTAPADLPRPVKSSLRRRSGPAATESSELLKEQGAASSARAPSTMRRPPLQAPDLPDPPTTLAHV